MKRADNIAATDSAINYAVSTVSLVRFQYIWFLNRGQDEIGTPPFRVHHAALGSLSSLSARWQ